MAGIKTIDKAESSRDVVDFIMGVLESYWDEQGESAPAMGTFKEAGFLTADKGFVITTKTYEFQITVTYRPK